jgi:hypothetical protein
MCECLGVIWIWWSFKVKGLIIVMKIIIVCGNNCAEHTNTLHRQIVVVDFFYVKAGGTKNYLCFEMLIN